MSINQQFIEKIVPRIKVMGFGGGGNNTIERIFRLKIPEVELIAVNTNRQDLDRSHANEKIWIGKDLTGGFGTGGNVDLGIRAAEESYKELIQKIKDTDLLFLTAGMGGGTGSGAIQIAARIAQSMDILTIALVTLPFSFEARRRLIVAADSTACLRPYTDTLVTIPNDRLLSICNTSTPLSDAFQKIDDLLIQTITGLKNVLSTGNLMGIDFSHIIRLMKSQGASIISTGKATGPDRLEKSIKKALQHPMLEEVPISEAAGLIVQFSGNTSLIEIEQGIELLSQSCSPQTEIIPVVNDTPQVIEDIEIFIIATGIKNVTLDNYIDNTPKVYKDKVNDELGQISEKIDIFQVNQDHIDDLAVPAYVRKGYNLKE